MEGYERLPTRTSEDANAAADVNQITENIGAVKDITDSLDARVDALEAFPYLYARDEKPNSTVGGTFTAGGWETRTLNTIVSNGISGASLNGNKINLPSGLYYISGRLPVYRVDRNKPRLYNVTANAVIIYGMSNYSSSSYYTYNDAIITGKIILVVESEIRLEHRGETTIGNIGFGLACNFGTIEVYAELEIWKM